MDNEDERGYVLTRVLASIARVWPGPVPNDTSLDHSLEFLNAKIDGVTVYRACYVIGVVLGAVAFLTLQIFPFGRLMSITFLSLAIGVAYAGPSVPHLAARIKRTRALGAAPSLVVRAALSMELTPSPERAARFAAESGDGVLAESLDGHVRRSSSGPRTGFHTFAIEWRQWFPELERSWALIESTSGMSPEQRSATLDRARNTVLTAAKDHMSEYAASIRGPVSAVYAFGVLLPLALVSLLPALRAAGIPASIALIATIYNVLLPLGLLASCTWLLSRRPVAFPPPTIDRSHPDIPAVRWRGPVAGLVAGALVWWITPTVLPQWAVPIAILGAISGTTLVVYSHPETKVRESVIAVEDGLSDALSLLGRRIERGESVELSLPQVANNVPESTGEVLSEAASRQRRLGIGVAEAFLGPDGAVSTLPSQQIHGTASLFSLAAREGQPAGELITAMGDHLEELATVEAEAKRSVEEVTSTLSNTAAIFGPLVGGATVALAGAMGSAGPLTGGEMTGALGITVGVYVLFLAALLTALSTGLSSGFDRTLVSYRVGIALLASVSTYLAAFVGTGQLV